MTALAIADLHLSSKSRDAYRFETMRTIPGLLRKYKVQQLLVLGDLTEEKDYHPAPLVNAIVDMFYAFSEVADVIVLTGNHDYAQANCPFFHFLRRLQNVHWVGAPAQHNLSIGDCLFLPHTRDHKVAWASVELDHHHWIFAHNSFEGAVSEHGKRLSGIPTKVFPEGARVVSGDIHTPQEVGCVTYIGSPYTVDFGDSFDPRALLLTRERARSIPLPGPQKQLIDISRGYDPELAYAQLQTGDIVKVRYTLALDEQDKWFTIREKIKAELSRYEVVKHLVQPVTTAARSKSIELRRAQSKSDGRLVTEYGKQMKIPENTLKVGLELLRKA